MILPGTFGQAIFTCLEPFRDDRLSCKLSRKLYILFPMSFLLILLYVVILLHDGQYRTFFYPLKDTLKIEHGHWYMNTIE